MRYNLYRRSYPEGVYEKIADGLEATAYEDRNVDNASLVGYIIVAENTDTGETGMHSREVNNQQTHAFVDFLNTDFPAGDTSIRDNTRVLSFKELLPWRQIRPRMYDWLEWLAGPTRVIPILSRRPGACSRKIWAPI